jgi:L-asparaginase
MDAPLVHILFTGGTISMRRDAAAGGNVPAHGGDDLVRLAPGIERIAPLRVEDWARMPACHFDLARLWALRERVRAVAASGDAGGIVVTHGTDILEETAYLLDRTLDREIPVVVTGAMRTSSETEWDGPGNLRDAVTVAASPESRGRGAMVTFAGRVFAGAGAVKTHATDVDAFSAPHAGPIGRIHDRNVVFDSAPAPDVAPITPDSLPARVAHVPMVVGDDGAVLDLLRPFHDGVVIEAFGSGNVPPGAVPAIARWLEERKPVVLASRCPWGMVTPVYAFDGGGARTTGMGAIPAGPRTPSQARMELTIALSAGVPYGST